ncbi:MAG: hypothetical protein NTX16_07800 [Actinobacteria bacterium]|nr:hypothetical protein [Actinomycetota bacterium]
MKDAARPRPRAFGPLALDDGRLRFLDLARGLAIVFMVFQHVQLLFAVGSGEDSLLGATFLLLGTACAATRRPSRSSAAPGGGRSSRSTSCSSRAFR